MDTKWKTFFVCAYKWLCENVLELVPSIENGEEF